MNNACCKPAASAVGVRAAALGSRGLLFNQRQCIFIMGTKGSPSPLSARSSLPHPYLPRATRPLESCNRQPSFFVVQCSGQEPAAYVLLKTTGINFFSHDFSKIGCVQTGWVKELNYCTPDFGRSSFRC